MSDLADALTGLVEAIRAEGGLLADAAVSPAPGAETRYGELASEGPRAARSPREYALLVEAIREGYLLHYGSGRVIRTDDEDLALLAGDRLYALGLDRLAALGDLDAVAILADLISAGAQVNAEGRPADAEAVWARGAAAVGRGRAVN